MELSATKNKMAEIANNAREVATNFEITTFHLALTHGEKVLIWSTEDVYINVAARKR